MALTELTLARFVQALRSAEVTVSPAETLDAFAVVNTIGIDDPGRLYDALSLTLAKTRQDKERFRICFERFFHQLAFRQPAKRTFLRNVDPQAVQDSLDGLASDRLSSLVDGILRQDHGQLAWRVQREAERLGTGEMRALRDKGRHARRLGAALGLEELEALLARGEPADSPDTRDLLRYLRQYASFCLRVDICSRLEHIERFADRLLTITR